MNLERLRSRIVVRVGASAGIIVILALISYLYYRLHERVEQLEWEIQLLQHHRDIDLVALDVSSIQFLRNGYSVSFEEVSYDTNGVTIAGRIGNPHFIQVSSLTLVFTVTKPFYAVREEYLDNPYSVLLSPEYNVGSAQVSVGTVAPGSTASFRAVIPNVKQSLEAYEVAVSFSGERYSYLR